jgi:hypothetical protein
MAGAAASAQTGPNLGCDRATQTQAICRQYAAAQRGMPYETMYAQCDWEKALAGFEDCLAIVPCDAPSKLFLERIAQFRVTAPCAEWNGVWSLVEK